MSVQSIAHASFVGACMRITARDASSIGLRWLVSVRETGSVDRYAVGPGLAVVSREIRGPMTWLTNQIAAVRSYALRDL